MKNLCLFDLDGTLIASKVGITKSVSYALDSFGIHVSDLDDLTKFVGPPLRDSFQEFYNFTEAQAEKAVSKFREYYSETGIFENTLYNGIIDVLDRLKKEMVMLVIATSKTTVYAERIAGHFGFRQYFDLIVGCEFDGTRSRKSEVINHILNKIDPERKKSTVMIGDKEHDIIGGWEAGIDSIGVTWGYGSRSELEKAGATWIVDKPDELYRCIMSENM